jgi:DNA polymerase
MSFITLDFETFYRSKANKGSPGKSYSLKHLTYEQYLRHEEFQIYGVGVKIDQEKTFWVEKDDVKIVLHELFTPNNTHNLLCHNTMFDGAILHWMFGLKAGTYHDTLGMSRACWNHLSSGLGPLAERLFPSDDSKRKGDELSLVDGVITPDPETMQKLAGYCIQDVELTFECFKEMLKFFPRKELDVIDLTLKMFVEPAFILDAERVQRHHTAIETARATLVQNSGVPKSVLSSNKQYAEYLEKHHEIIIPQKSSPTPKNPNNTTWALAKDDIEYTSIQNEHPELNHIWEARTAVKSTLEQSRALRLLDHAKISPINRKGQIAAPLTYCAAHTKRWGGTNKVNFQNFKRGSELRKSLTAPKDHEIGVADLSNIEGRMLAWFAGEEKLLSAFKEGRDIYSEFASMIYSRPINRKYKAQDKDGNYLDENGGITDIDNAFKPMETEGFVGKVAVLGLGYGMGPSTLQTTFAKGAMGGPPLFFGLNECYRIVHKVYRGTYSQIKEIWRQADRWIQDMANPNMKPYTYKCIRIEYRRIQLPNDLYLDYPNLGLNNEQDPRSGYCYHNGKYWVDIYGGKLIENIIQALARIVMSDMMLEIQAYLNTLPKPSHETTNRVILTVHDEIIALLHKNYSGEALEKIIELMSVPPDWCDDGTLYLAAEGGKDYCYSK